MFLQQDFLLEEGSAVLALEHVRNCCVSSQSLLRGQCCLALLAFEHVLRSSVHLKGPSVVAFVIAVFAILLMGFHVARHLVPTK